MDEHFGSKPKGLIARCKCEPQCYCSCTHDIMLTSLIAIHLLKSKMWHYENFWT